MKRLLPALMGFALLLLSSTEGWSLPHCPGSPTSSRSTTSNWTDCIGTLTYNKGVSYVGEWKDGKQHGQGTFVMRDLLTYVGEYKNGTRNGQGTTTFTYTGHKYVGEHKNGMPNGQGTYTDADGSKYVGEHKNNLPHGQGTYTYASGNKYVGEWRNGKKNGQGTYTWANGNKYVGELKDGNQHGQGTFTVPDYYTYVGEWKNGKRHGQGAVTFVDGGKYVGEFRDTLYHGQGTETDADGSKYVGEWKDHMMHGQGTFTFASGKYAGDKYVGEFEFSDYHGYGTLTYANGDKYVGEFKYRLRHGQGTLTYANGRVKEGIWEKGELKHAWKTPRTVITKKKPKPSGSSGSGFFISKLGHVITNQHVVSDCRKVTVGDNSKKQVTATVMETDRRNDLALLRISNMQMASVETKSLIRKLGIKVVPLASDGLMRAEDVELGEDVLVSGYPYGAVFSDNIKVNKGIVSGLRGMGDDTGQFQIDAAVQPGNSGGPIYDENGNIVGVVVSQLNKMKFAKATGSIPENVNFGIKASTVRQFLNASGLPTKWSKRSKSMSTRELAKIAKSQTVMVVCHR